MYLGKWLELRRRLDVYKISGLIRRTGREQLLIVVGGW